MSGLSVVRRLSHLTLSTNDLERDLDYYTEVLGLSLVDRDRGQAHLATFQGLPALALEADGRKGVRRIAFQAAPSTDLERLGETLKEQGIDAERRNEPRPMTTTCLSFKDPDGTDVELIRAFDFAPRGKTQRSIMPLKVGHVAFLTRDVQRLVRFYRETLGFRLSDWRENAAYFLRCNPDHHTLNFFQSSEQRVEHIAFELRDAAEVTRACDTLAMANIRLDWGPSRHFIGHNFACYHYVRDGFRVELYAELDQMKDEELGFFEPRPWHQDHPQKPRAWTSDFTKNYWGAR